MQYYTLTLAHFKISKIIQISFWFLYTFLLIFITWFIFFLVSLLHMLLYSFTFSVQILFCIIFTLLNYTISPATKIQWKITKKWSHYQIKTWNFLWHLQRTKTIVLSIFDGLYVDWYRKMWVFLNFLEILSAFYFIMFFFIFYSLLFIL